MSKIYFKPTTLEEQFPTQIDPELNFLELNDNHLIWRVKFFADEPVNPGDKSMGLKNELNDYYILAKREKVSGVEKSIMVGGKRWVIAIILTGFGSDIKIYFAKEQEAENMRDKICKWILK